MDRKLKSNVDSFMDKDDSANRASVKQSTTKSASVGNIIYMLPSFNESPEDESDVQVSSSLTKQVNREPTNRRKCSDDDRTFKVKRTQSLMINKSSASLASPPAATAPDVAKLKLTLPSIGPSFGPSDKSAKLSDINRDKKAAAKIIQGKICVVNNFPAKFKKDAAVAENLKIAHQRKLYFATIAALLIICLILFILFMVSVTTRPQCPECSNKCDQMTTSNRKAILTDEGQIKSGT